MIKSWLAWKKSHDRIYILIARGRERRLAFGETETARINTSGVVGRRSRSLASSSLPLPALDLRQNGAEKGHFSAELVFMEYTACMSPSNNLADYLRVLAV